MCPMTALACMYFSLTIDDMYTLICNISFAAFQPYPVYFAASYCRLMQAFPADLALLCMLSMMCEAQR